MKDDSSCCSSAKRLHQEKAGKFSCLAGIGGHVSAMLASVEGSDKVLVLDGCPVGCAAHAMARVGLDNYYYVVVTDLGIERKHNFELPPEEIDRVLLMCRKKLNGPSTSREDSYETQLVESPGSGGSCCCGSDGGCS